jgi:hypothetical protein
MMDAKEGLSAEEELKLKKGFIGPIRIKDAYKLIIHDSIETARQVTSRAADDELTNMLMADNQILVGNCCCFGIDEDGEVAFYLTSTPYNPIFNLNNFVDYFSELTEESFVTLKDREAKAIRKGVLNGKVSKHVYSKLNLEKDHNYTYYKSNHAERDNRKPEELSLEEHVRDGKIQVPPIHITLPSIEVVKELTNKYRMIAFLGIISQNLDRLGFDAFVSGMRLKTEGFYIFGKQRDEPIELPQARAQPDKKSFLM